MGLEHLAAVLDHSRHGGSRLVVLLVVASYSDQRGEWIANQPTLQKRSRLGRRRVQRILDELVADGELAVVSHQGRGKLSAYRLLLPPLPVAGGAMGEGGRGGEVPEKASRSTPFLAEAQAEKGGQEATFSADKGGPGDAFPAAKGVSETAFSSPPCPPSPPVPLSPLNPPEKQQETFGLRPLTGPQTAVFRINLLLEEAGVPLPSPAQIGLWSKTLGGIEPLLELLRRLIEAGLANKREPIVYAHRVVMERAARPEPARRLDARAGRERLRAAGADEVRWQQALEIIANTEES